MIDVGAILLTILGAIVVWLIARQLPGPRAKRRLRLQARIARVRERTGAMRLNIEKMDPSPAAAHALECLGKVEFRLKFAEKELYQNELIECWGDISKAEDYFDDAKTCLWSGQQLDRNVSSQQLRRSDAVDCE
jgi:hypothetical protein